MYIVLFYSMGQKKQFWFIELMVGVLYEKDVLIYEFMQLFTVSSSDRRSKWLLGYHQNSNL